MQRQRRPLGLALPSLQLVAYVFNPAMFSVITSNTSKSGNATVSFVTPYVTVPKMFVGIYRLTAAPGSIMQFTVTAPNTTITVTGFKLGYTVGASTSISVLSIYTMSM
jgi:hypothetical protein